MVSKEAGSLRRFDPIAPRLGTWTEDTYRTGLVASVATTAVAAALGNAQNSSAVSDINRVSHLLKG